ncbi:MAG: putative Ig domain-containing protein, partial [Clostridiales bacterium]|nr:putative Ig domain-containing protein [Clostridiales bacterium]MDY5530307.1 putative Ig domain-containing protein [Eubacteriales bacterium]
SDNISVAMYVYSETSKPKITTTQADIKVGYKNSLYSQRIFYESGIGEPSEASIKNGNLPKGLILRQAGFGIYIEGKPTEEGTFTFTVHVENSAGFDEKQYTITIKDEVAAPEIQMQMTVINDSYSKVNDSGNLEIIKGKPVDVQFYATGTNTPEKPIKWSCDETVLPAGLTLSESGHLTGTVAESVDLGLGIKYFYIKLKATNVSSGVERSNTSSAALIVCENGKITGVTVSPKNTSVPKGGQRQFTATVIGYGDFDKSVTWDIYDYSAGTTISQDGVLTVGIDETATTIRVEARSKGDTNILKEIPVTIINHTHTTTLVPATPKTCTTDGNIEHYKCNVCGDLFADAGAVNQLTEGQVKIPAGHEYGDLVPKQEPTCKQTGMQAHYKCSVCNKYFDESKTEKTEAELTIPVNPNAHDFGAWIEEVPATCKDTGVKAHEDCNRCNRHFDESGNEIADLTIPTNDNHDWNAWVSNGNGTHTRTCKRDSGHKENGTCSGGTATCTTKAVCDVCRTTYGDTAPHDYGELIPEVAATTTEFGVKEHKDCKVCGKHFDKDGNEITELRIAKIGTHNVIVNGESKFYSHGESVTVTAEEKEGKVFQGWQDETGKIVSTDKSYTFTVNGETTLTAVYEDKSSGGGEITPPAKKDGLSGGQIAGIVIGSVAVAGIGGFAIFWFAVKKKTFADLITAIKETVNKVLKKGNKEE